jgi:hypothetical protein
VKGRIGELVESGVAIDDAIIPFNEVAKAHIEIEFKSLKKGNGE